jgi:hypothetical protein
MTIHNENSDVKPDFSFKTSIKTCLVPSLIIATILYFLVQLYVFIESNQASIGAFFRLEYSHLNYLLSAIYLIMIAATYVTCCNIKYNKAFTKNSIVIMYSSLVILYVGLMVIMFYSFKNLELFTQTQSILHTFTFVPLWLLIIAFILFVFYLFFVFKPDEA